MVVFSLNHMADFQTALQKPRLSFYLFAVFLFKVANKIKTLPDLLNYN